MRVFLFALVFAIFHLPVWGQQGGGTMEDFYVENEYLFRMQVSRFYPLTAEMLERYKEDWVWHLVSENTAIKWSDALLEKFGRHLNWETLQRNPSILWNELRMEQHRNDLNWFDLSQNPGLPVDEAWIQRHEKDIIWYFFSQNPAFVNHPELIKKFQSRIDTTYRRPVYQKASALFKSMDAPAAMQAKKDVPVNEIDENLIARYFDHWQTAQMVELPNFPWSVQHYEQVAPMLNSIHQLGSHEQLYKRVFEPFLTDTMVEGVMQRLSLPGVLRFYRLHQGEDEWGPVPTVLFSSGFTRVFFPNEMIQDTLLDSLPACDFVLDKYVTPQRFADIHEWGNHKPRRTATLFVSEKVKGVLERFHLPAHRFYPVVIQLDDVHYGRGKRRYYIFHMATCDYLYFDYEQMQFFKTGHFPIGPGLRRYHLVEPVIPKIKSPREFLALSDSLNDQDKYIEPMEYIWKSDLDVIACAYDFWLSEDVKMALEAAGVTGVEFRKIREMPPRMLGAETAVHRARNAGIIAQIRREWSTKPSEPDQITVANFKIDCARCDSLMASKERATRLGSGARPVGEVPESVVGILRQKESEWDVLFPSGYVETMSHPDAGSKLGALARANGYELRSVGQITQVDKKWCRFYPFAAKAILIGDNGTGDLLALLLQPGSDRVLGDAVYEITHDPPEVRVIGRM